MTAAAIPALERQVRYAEELFVTLTPAEWASTSGCDGWRVQDVAQHMSAVFQLIADASSIETGDSGRTESDAEVPVQARRGWTTDQVIEGYAEWSAKGVAALAGMQQPPMAEIMVPMSDLGTHPLHLLGNAIVFDHYCHLRHDIGAGIPRAAALPQDEGALVATREWMLAGLPQMCAADLAAAPQVTVNIAFDGPGGGDFVLAPGAEGWTIADGSAEGAPSVRSTVHEFVSWGTKRSDWRTAVSGDTADPDVATVLDAINII